MHQITVLSSSLTLWRRRSQECLQLFERNSPVCFLLLLVLVFLSVFVLVFSGFGFLAIVCVCARNCLYLSLFLCFFMQSLLLVFLRNSPAVCDCLLHRATCDDGQHLDQKTNIIRRFCWRDEVVADRHEESEGAGGEAEGEQVQLAILARRVHLAIAMRMRMRMRMRILTISIDC